jgi:prenyltransferase/squalene oxidase-like repeat protein
LSPSSLRKSVEAVLSRRLLSDGGMAGRLEGPLHIDSTAWGVLALRASGGAHEVIEQLCTVLVREQHGDGRVCMNRANPASFWPTPLAVLAWQNSIVSQVAQSRAVHFLLSTTGVHFAKRPTDPSAHDPNLKGWPWMEDTHSWVEPTALCVMALRVAGHGQHDRVREALRMILDRQLPHGGWNVGNTLVFGRELYPMPESTGAALVGLAGEVDRSHVDRSIDYLQGEVDRLRTPISLGWGLLGLSAWDRWPANGLALVERCLANQARYGDYDTSALCLLFMGGLAGELEREIPLFSRPIHRQASTILTQ